MKSVESNIRINKLQSLELEYQDYLSKQKGIFVLKCQMMSEDFSKILNKINIMQMMHLQRNFIKT